MTNQINSVKRTTSVQKNGTGIKAIIMAASLVATIGGWGVLAVGQVNDTIVAMQQAPALVQSAGTTIQNNATNQTTLRPVTIPATQPRSIARTRSSR
jgi:hypothetical protein